MYFIVVNSMFVLIDTQLQGKVESMFAAGLSQWNWVQPGRHGWFVLKPETIFAFQPTGPRFGWLQLSSERGGLGWCSLSHVQNSPKLTKYIYHMSYDLKSQISLVSSEHEHIAQ